MIFSFVLSTVLAQEPPPVEPSGAPEPVLALSSDPWEALTAIETERIRKTRYLPGAFGAIAVGEVSAGLIAAFALERPELGVGLVAGGFLHGTTAALTLETNGRRANSYRTRIAGMDTQRPGATSAIAEQWRLAAERDARANAFAVGVNVGAVLAGGLLMVMPALPTWGGSCFT